MTNMGNLGARESKNRRRGTIKIRGVKCKRHIVLYMVIKGMPQAQVTCGRTSSDYHSA